jgi:hypothetical protein
VKATVNTFKKAISFKNDLFSDGSSGDPDVILDPFEFRCVARIFDNSAGAKGPDAGRLCADMKTRELYSANRYFELPRDTGGCSLARIRKSWRWIKATSGTARNYRYLCSTPVALSIPRSRK